MRECERERAISPERESYYSFPRCTMGLFCGDVGLFCGYTFGFTHVHTIDLYTTLAHSQYTGMISSKYGFTHTTNMYIYVYMMNIYL